MCALAFVTDALDGCIARATEPTRIGRDLEGLADWAFAAAALRGALRRDWLSRGAAAASSLRLGDRPRLRAPRLVRIGARPRPAGPARRARHDAAPRGRARRRRAGPPPHRGRARHRRGGVERVCDRWRARPAATGRDKAPTAPYDREDETTTAPDLRQRHVDHRGVPRARRDVLRGRTNSIGNRELKATPSRRRRSRTARCHERPLCRPARGPRGPQGPPGPNGSGSGLPLPRRGSRCPSALAGGTTAPATEA